MRILSKIWRCLKRATQFFAALIALYLIIALVGLIPVNNDYKPPSDGVEMFVVSNPVHADVVLPIETDVVNWRDHFPADHFRGDTSGATHIAIGWGDQGFYIETPTWADLRISTATNALFWQSETCLHVTYTRADYLGKDARSVSISADQYERLVRYIDATLEKRTPIPNAAYGSSDAFYEAEGNYHCFNTCNNWVGDGLEAAGVRTGWFTPLPKSVFMYLPKSAAEE